MPEIAISAFPETLKALRLKRHWSQKTLANKLNYDRSLISRWENGDRTPDIDQAKAIALLFQVSLDELC